MMVTPPPTGYRSPVPELMVATEVLLLLQVPPETELVYVVVALAQMVDKPTIAAGVGLTVITLVA